ncbi:MAG TPA: CopD family protein [Ktedonobacterales bacterium]|nr:CopD family protein [Ktedonobacterales bacterium]
MGLPEFSALAIVSAFLLAATGSLNTVIHLTSIDQFITTAYGRTLTIKIGLFLLMVLISAYHAFVLRPRLSLALTRQSARVSQAVVEAEEVGALVAASPRAEAITSGPSTSEYQSSESSHGGEVPPHAQRLVGRMESWLRREALLGCAVLLCVALLAAFAGSLATTPAGAAAPSGSSGAYLKTQVVGGYAITLQVTPAKFGTNTFTVTVLNAQKQPITNAEVLLQTTMVEMNMGVSYAQLLPSSSLPPGTYTGQSDLTMGGHWNILVKILPPKVSQFLTTFTIPVTY